MSLPGSVRALVSRADSWVNAMTGLGTVRDKLTHAQVVPGAKLADGTLEALFNDDDLAKRLVTKVPREATRRGFDLELEGAEDAEGAEVNRELMDSLRRMHAVPKLREGWIWGRLYGGGAVFVGADDGQDPARPLNEAAISSLRFLNVLRRPQLHVYQRYADTTAPNYGEPEIFEVHQAPSSGNALVPTGRLIHASRLIVFGGALTACSWGARADGWEDSVLQGVHNALRETATAWQSSAHLISDASQGVLKIANLVDLIATGGQAELRTRIELMDIARSVCRSMLIDADRESFERVATSFAGLPEMMDRMMMRVAAAAEMPVTILFGRSPAGLNATGESDIRGWYDVVSDAQTDVLQPRLERLLQLVMLSTDGPTGGALPDRWHVRFRPLWQPTELEQAQVLKLKADTHVALVGAQIEMEAEAGIGLARDFPSIDAEHRRDLLKADLEAGLRPGEATTRELPDPDDDPDDPDADPDDGDEEGSPARNRPKARADSGAQPRDAIGRWSRGGSLTAARSAFHAAREAHKAAPTADTRAARGAALQRVKQRRILAARAPGRFEVARPVLGATERHAYLAPHRQAVHAAQVAHATAPTAETARSLAGAHANLRAQRRLAGSTTSDPRSGGPVIQAAKKQLRSAREHEEQQSPGSTGHAHAAQQREAAETHVLDQHALHSTPEGYRDAAVGIHEHNTSARVIAREYHGAYQDRVAEGETPREAHSGAKQWVTEIVVDQATGVLRDRLAAPPDARVATPGKQRASIIKHATAEARDRVRGVAEAFRSSPR